MRSLNEYPAIAGHQLRHVISQRWGDLIQVGDTDRAYVNLDEAMRDARSNPLTYAILEIEYRTFGLKHRITWLGSADEHLVDPRLTDAQRLWLVEFCRRWQSIAEFEREQEEGRRDASQET